MKWDETGNLLQSGHLIDWQNLYQKQMTDWQSDSTAKNAANLIFVCWYPLIEPTLTESVMMIQEELKDTLKATAQTAVSEYGDDPYFALVVGYCIVFSPDNFGESKEWQAIGKSLLESSHKHHRDDPIAAYLYRTWVNREVAHDTDLDSAAAEAAATRFNGGDLVSAYFRQVIGGA